MRQQDSIEGPFNLNTDRQLTGSVLPCVDAGEGRTVVRFCCLFLNKG